MKTTEQIQKRIAELLTAQDGVTLYLECVIVSESTQTGSDGRSWQDQGRPNRGERVEIYRADQKSAQCLIEAVERASRQSSLGGDRDVTVESRVRLLSRDVGIAPSAAQCKQLYETGFVVIAQSERGRIRAV